MVSMFAQYDWWQFPVLFAIGVFVGINNVLAGGGSLISMPFLIFMGLDSATANGTNRLAIAIQNVFAVSGFKKHGVSDWRYSLQLAAPAVPGAVLGVITAVKISDGMFRKVLSVVMVMVLILILTKRSRSGNSDQSPQDLTRGQKISTMAAFGAIGFYAGFIQAGVGFIVIGTLTWLTGMNLVRINAVKVFVIGLLTWIAVIIFAAYGRIVWPIGLVLAFGNALGGWLGSQAAVIGGEKWIKRILVVAVLAMALKLSGLADWILGMTG